MKFCSKIIINKKCNFTLKNKKKLYTLFTYLFIFSIQLYTLLSGAESCHLLKSIVWSNQLSGLIHSFFLHGGAYLHCHINEPYGYVWSWKEFDHKIKAINLEKIKQIWLKSPLCYTWLIQSNCIQQDTQIILCGGIACGFLI